MANFFRKNDRCLIEGYNINFNKHSNNLHYYYYIIKFTYFYSNFFPHLRFTRRRLQFRQSKARTFLT